jgi:hypothetical protein
MNANARMVTNPYVTNGIIDAAVRLDDALTS